MNEQKGLRKQPWNSRFWLYHIPDMEGSAAAQKFSAEMLASKERVREMLVKSKKLNQSRIESASHANRSALPRLCAELTQLFEEAQIARENKELFFGVLEGLSEPKACSVVEFELKQMRKRSSMLQQIGRAIAQREEALGLLHYLADFYEQTPSLLAHRPEVLKCAEAITRLRLSSLQVVEGVEKWRGYLSSLLALQSDSQVNGLCFVWEEVNYLTKMRLDLDFLVQSSLAQAFQFTESDPFLLLCATCGSVPESDRIRGLVFYPSDTGKHLVPVAPPLLARMRLSEVVILDEARPKDQRLTTASSPHSPNRGSFAQPVRSASVSAPLPVTQEIDPKLIFELIFEALLLELVSKETKTIAYDGITSYRLEETKQVAKAVTEKYLEQYFTETVRDTVKTAFAEVTRAKLILHSSNILDDIVLYAITEEIPKIAVKAMREEAALSNVLIAERILLDLVTAKMRVTVLETVNETIADGFLALLIDREIFTEVEEVLKEEETAFRTTLATSILQQLLEDWLVETSEKVANKLVNSVVDSQPNPEDLAEHPSAANHTAEQVTSSLDSLESVSASQEMVLADVSSLGEEDENQAAVIDSRAASDLVAMLIGRTLDKFDFYALAEEVCFAELSTSSLPFGEKTAILEHLRMERVVRLLYLTVVDSWVSQPWLWDLCDKRLRTAHKQASFPLLLSSPSALCVEERIESMLESLAAQSPRSSDTTEQARPDVVSLFANSARLDMLLVFASHVKLVPVEVHEEDLPSSLFSYFELLQPPISACVTSPEALLLTMRGAICPQWFWLMVEERIVGLACFRDDSKPERVVCEHFSCLDFKFYGFCFDEIMRWALDQYQEVRIRMYYEEKIPTEFSRFLASKAMKKRTIVVSETVKCMELCKRKTSPSVLRPVGLVFTATSVDPHIDAPEAFVASRLLEFAAQHKGLSRYISNGTLTVSLRIPGSECRLEAVEGRMYRWIRVFPEFTTRRIHPRGLSFIIVKTTDPNLSLLLLQATSQLPVLSALEGLLQEAETLPESKSDVWFPNFSVQGKAADIQVSLICAREEPSASVKAFKSGMMLNVQFVCGLLFTPPNVPSETILASFAIEHTMWDTISP